MCRVYMFSECLHKFILGAPASSHSEDMHFYHYTIYRMPTHKFNRVMCIKLRMIAVYLAALRRKYGILEHILKFMHMVTVLNSSERIK